MALRPMVFIPDPFPKVQLAISNPEQWNTDWENIYERSPELTKPAYIMWLARSQRQRSLMFGGNGTRSFHEDRHAYTVNYESTCAIQHRIGRSTIDAFVMNDFERRWLTASVEERRKHGLVGLANAGAQAKNLNAARASCSDILRLRYLTEDGEVLLQLLRDITPQDISFVPKEPYYFPNAEWDALRAEQQRNPNTSEDEKFDLMEVFILRTKLICEYFFHHDYCTSAGLPSERRSRCRGYHGILPWRHTAQGLGPQRKGS